MGALDAGAAQVLDDALTRLTVHAEALNRELAQDVRADRWAGRRARPAAADD